VIRKTAHLLNSEFVIEDWYTAQIKTNHFLAKK